MIIHQNGKFTVVMAGEYFMVVIGEKMYGKFHLKQRELIIKMLEGEGQ